jgi:hypothetical protein
MDYFARAFVEMGMPTWPNGFDLDLICRWNCATRARSRGSQRSRTAKIVIAGLDLA